jgi:uncharacterized membrane protein YphA (DoxX/SURF4 family)
VNQWTRAALIALRIVVGWHFLYEGLWKTDSDTGSTAYTTARYTLQANTARLHDYFSQLPAEGWKPEPELAQVDAWYDGIVKGFAAYKQLDDAQKARLAVLRDKVKLAAIAAARGTADTADVANFDWAYVHEEVLKIAGEPEGERFSSLGYLQSSAGPFRPLFRSLVPDLAGFERLTVESVGARIDRRHAEIVEHFASAGKPLTPEQQKRLAGARDSIKASAVAIVSDPRFQSRLVDYKTLAERTARDQSRLDAPYSHERLAADRKKLDLIATEMLAIVNEPLSELAVQMHQIVTADQLGAGPLPRPNDPSLWVDRSIKVSLTGIGVCLLLGVFTRIAGLAAAAQLAVFYLASPPWPGLPAATLGGHYLYVDRNLIELAAALVIAATAAHTRLLVWRRPAAPADEAFVQEPEVTRSLS